MVNYAETHNFHYLLIIYSWKKGWELKRKSRYSNWTKEKKILSLYEQTLSDILTAQVEDCCSTHQNILWFFILFFSLYLGNIIYLALSLDI